MIVEPRLAAQGSQRRQAEGRKLLNRFDPVYFVLNRLLFAPFFSPRLPGPNGPTVAIEVAEVGFLLDNIRKHRWIVWVNLIAGGMMWASGVSHLDKPTLVGLLPGLAPPLVVSGIAWYTVSFSGVPERFVRHAMLVTGVLFLAVSLSLTTLFMVLAALVPTAVAFLVLTPIYLALYFAAVLYDNLDGLRAAAGHDAPVFSRAQAYLPDPQRTETESPTPPTRAQPAPHDLTLVGSTEAFDERVTRLDRLLEELAGQQHPASANVLISDCLTEVSRLLSLTALPLEPSPQFQRLVSHAHEMSVDDVNDLAAHHTHVVLERLQALLGDRVVDETAMIAARLLEIERIRAEGPQGDAQTDTQEQRQQLADLLFVQVFRQIVSIMRANRTRLLSSRH